MRLTVAVAVACLIGGVSIADDAGASTRRPTNIPAQNLGAALQTLASHCDVQVVYFSQAVDALQTQGVVGELTTEEAFSKVLSGTGLTYRYLGDKTITIVPLSGAAATATQPVPVFSGQDRSAPKAAGEETASDEGKAKGSFWGRFRLAQSNRADAANDASVGKGNDAPGANGTPVQLEDVEVVVTGTRGRERTVTSSATPIDIVPGSDIEQAGQGSVLGALNTLIPSFNEPTRAGGSTATVIATGGLRGLNPDQTLILVNGKRRHKSSLINAVSSLYNGSVPVDLDMIPASAIDHIEVLRDGAAAQYGSDAVAGVINIILKSDTSDPTLSGTGGQNMDRSDGQIYTQLGHVGFNLNDAGFLDLSASSKQQLASNRALPLAASIRLYNLVGGQPDPREATVDRLVTTNYGNMPQQSFDTGYNAGYHIGNGIEIYSFGTFSHRISDLNFTYRAPTNTASLPELYPNGFRPRELIGEIDYESALGIRGLLAGWQWDLSTSYGTDQARLSGDQSLNASLGPTSPTAFAIGELRSAEWVNSLDLTHGIALGEGNLQVSTGLQHRQERYEILQGDAAASTIGTYVIPAGQPNAGTHAPPYAQAFGGISPNDAGHLSRNNLAAYIDLAYDPTERLTLGAAGRFEHYNDASGNSAIGKFSVRYALTRWLALRGDVNSGFRAPALAQELFSSTTGQFQLVGGALTLLQIKALPVASPSAVALGATPLKPETSRNYSAGLVLTPLNTLDVTLDAYSIDVDKRIVPTGTLTGAAVSQILASHGLASNISATYFTNAINTRTRGLDLVAAYRVGLGAWGRMRLNAGFNYNDNTITRIIPNPPQLAALGPSFVIFDRLSQGNMTVGLPKTKIFLGDTWTWSDFTLTPRLVRYGGYQALQDNPTQDRSFAARWITDLELSWQATRKLNVAVGADNLFNLYPSANGIFNTATGTGQYNTTSPFGFTGGFYYGRITVSF